ncbi:hypothetical protein BC351_10330 [Paenibacillus ferrarius]|uniref:Carbohydrate-binding module family 96 domain-containing protein n=1 Tax=Paenibacillus ferrarius TaxID=1469647 RepID=A0A1V4H8P5_9BACL|nr:DNRLRE domain-containing protein [Paenibacillus ferrarius]OPH47580.1 hypothetical protein BC351_10330 [Paenibacillus ferrarius]
MAYIIINSMEGKYLVKRPLEVFLPLTAGIRLSLSSSILIQVAIPPNNQMEGVVEVAHRPTIKKIIKVARDAYVNESVPTLNYGNRSQLRVGVDMDGHKYRSFLLFDLSTLDKGLTFVSAKLNLNAANPIYSIDHIEISTLNKSFDEYGITWDNQPSRLKFIDILEVDKGSEKLIFTLTDVIKEWYLDSRTNNGILLKEFNNSLDKLISLHSKEGGYPPNLEVEYFDPTFGVPKQSTKLISLTVLNKKSSSIPISVNVITYMRDSTVPINMLVKSIRGELWVESRITVNKLPISLTVKQVRSDSIPVEFKVSHLLEDVIPLGMNVTQNSLPTRFNVRAISELLLESKISIRAIPLSLLVSKRDLDVSLNVRTLSEIPIYMSVSKKGIPIEFSVMKPSSIKIEANVLKRKNEYLNVSFSIGRTSIPIEFYYKQGTSIPIEFLLLGKRFNELPLTLSIYKSDYSVVPIEFETQAISDLLISMDVFSRNLDVSMFVLKNKESFKNLEMNVRKFDSLPLELHVTKFKDLLVYMEVKKIWFSDIGIRLVIGGKGKQKRSYVFIM